LCAASRALCCGSQTEGEGEEEGRRMSRADTLALHKKHLLLGHDLHDMMTKNAKNEFRGVDAALAGPYSPHLANIYDAGSREIEFAARWG
jgi:hypothetical protein